MPEDWSTHDNALVDKVTYFFSKGLPESSKKPDVESKGKAGRPPYPNSLILLSAIRIYFKPSYRQTEGMAKARLGRLGIKVPDYPTKDLSALHHVAVWSGTLRPPTRAGIDPNNSSIRLDASRYTSTIVGSAVGG